MHGSDVHRRDVLLIGIEDHVPGDAVVLLDIGQCVVNACTIEASLADGVEQSVHRVIGQRRKLLRLLVEAVLKAAIEAEPARILAGGIVGKHSLETFSRRASFGQQRGPQRAVGTKDALLHPGSLHFLEDFSRLSLIGP